jgi:hypothetical protein
MFVDKAKGFMKEKIFKTNKIIFWNSNFKKFFWTGQSIEYACSYGQAWHASVIPTTYEARLGKKVTRHPPHLNK